MSRAVVTPEQIDFDTPGRRDYFVTLEHTSIWAQHFIPVSVIVGRDAKPDRGLVAIGSTHGDEIEGPVAIKHLLREVKTEDVVGRVILIPVLNVMAFRANRRETPDDGVNLNRAFPGDAKGSVTYRLADFITRFVFPKVHVVLDIHSGGEVARFSPTANVHHIADPAQRKTMERAARDFGTPFVMVYQNLTPGLLTGLAEDMGKISIGTEAGWGRAVQAPGVSMARQGILSAAIRQGQMKGDLPPNRNVPAERQVMVDTSVPGASLLAPFEGLFEPGVELGARVKKGERLGFLHDFNHIDETPLELAAPHDGYVICQAWNARVLQGQVISQVGKALEWTV